jgi:hypothetical protein
MDWAFLDKELEYDGSQLKSLWAFRELGIKEDSIISFIGPCNVRNELMIDMEDSIQGEQIYSPKMLHFIVEHFDEVSMRLICARQRLLVCITKEVIGKDIVRDGNDLYWNGKKLSVSIASVSPVSAKIHFGINIESDKYASLSEMGYENVEELAIEICRRYALEIEDIEGDIRKTRPVGSF